MSLVHFPCTLFDHFQPHLNFQFPNQKGYLVMNPDSHAKRYVHILFSSMEASYHVFFHLFSLVIMPLETSSRCKTQVEVHLGPIFDRLEIGLLTLIYSFVFRGRGCTDLYQKVIFLATQHAFLSMVPIPRFIAS